jgi:integrase
MTVFSRDAAVSQSALTTGYDRPIWNGVGNEVGELHHAARAYGRSKRPSDDEGKKPWLPNRATKTFTRSRKAAGLSHFRLHDLRHFMATQMLDAGVPVMVVAARLAHARASTTLNVYAHAIPGSDQSAAEVLRARMA